ncbi:hypothetical protein LSH36_137g01037 [Paralvinella palmiformis]|uniref:non-specific serine/threonine protein kinase n=1 Tax=Paralvinella palmiformis TaxID=53620 RepID=A0AAD9N805_9ANNE|nr:hypothetical protein LSH36_137g01037 [Paralvinella palmiformis]
MPKKAAPAVKKRKAAAGAYKLPDPLPAGEILRDYCKKEWKLGKPIGAGGFGLIYLSDQNSPGPVSDNAPYALKLEPHANGPLFCELHFYQRVAKPEQIEEWTKMKRLKHLSVPRYITSGSHNYNHTQYRFMVMDRCGTDLQKLFERNGKSFPEKTVYMLGIKLLHALEYIHDKEYVHADIKASNILTGFSKQKLGEVYLVDYGLAFRYTSDGQHKEYKEDPKRAHDGTVEFTSRDAHKGVAPSRRGDLEILGYCMLQWLCRTLPWEDNLDDKDYVRDSKIRYMNKVSELIKKCLPGRPHDELKKFLEYVSTLKYDEHPDYNKCLSWFKQALKKFGGSESDKLTLQTGRSESPQRRTKITKKKIVNEQEELYVSEENSDSSSPKAKKRRSLISPRERGRKTTPRQRSAARNNTPTPRSGSPKKRVDSEGNLIPKPAIPPMFINGQMEVNGKVQPKARKSAKKNVLAAATQTSPGLQGLPRTRNRPKRH